MRDGGDGLFEVLLHVALRHVEQLPPYAEFGAGDGELAPRALLGIAQEERLVEGLVADELVRKFMRGIVLREKGEEALPALARALLEGEVAAALHDAAPR